MCSLKRSEKILSTFDAHNVIACRSLQKASQCQLNIPSMGNSKKENKINFRERHLPITLVFLGWYYFLKSLCVSSLVCCFQHLKSSNFVWFIFFVSLVCKVILPFSYFSPSKAFIPKFPCSFKMFHYLQNPSPSDFFSYTRGWKLKLLNDSLPVKLF